MTSSPIVPPTLPYADRVLRRSSDQRLALCVGVDAAPDSVALLEDNAVGRGDSRATRAGAMERFGGMVVEAVRDHAVAVKVQLAWFETAGAPGLRALERVVEYARRAGLLVVLDAKRGDVPHSALAYADAWLGEAAASGICGDALTVNASIGADSLRAMAEIAAERGSALFALLHTSNAEAAVLQRAPLADGREWWELLAGELATVDAELGGGVVGAVVGATHPDVIGRVRAYLPTSPLLVPGIGAQGGAVATLAPLAVDGAPPSLVTASRSLLPSEPMGTAGFRFAVTDAARALAAQLASVGSHASMG